MLLAALPVVTRSHAAAVDTRTRPGAMATQDQPCQQRLAVRLTQAAVEGGTGVSARVRLRCRVARDTRIRLAGFPSVTLPRSVTVARGARSAPFWIDTEVGSISRTGRITVVLGDKRARAQLVVLPTRSEIPDSSQSPGDACTPQVEHLAVPLHLHAGDDESGVVTLTCRPSAPTLVVLMASGGHEVDVPLFLTVPAGQRTRSFPIDTEEAWGPRQIVTVQASTDSSDLHFSSFVMDPGLSRFEIERSNFDTLEIVLGLSGPAPPGGLTVTYSSTEPAVVTVPKTQHFPAGSYGGRLEGLSTTTPADDASVTVSASLSETTRDVTDVRIGESSSVGDLSMTFDGQADEFFGGGVGHKNVWLATERPAPRGGADITFTIESDRPAITTLSSAYLWEGDKTLFLDFHTLEVTQPTDVTITATSQGHTGTLTLTIRPRMLGLELPDTAEARTWWTGKVLMAGTSDLPTTVYLHTGWGVMDVTYSVTVPPGATEAVFTGRSGQISTPTKIKVYAYINDYHQAMGSVLITPAPD
jgi:hypothetical protein